MNINKKVVKYLALVCLAAWLIVMTVFGARLNAYLSTFSPWVPDGGGPVDYDSQDQNIDFELAPGETLVLPISLEARLSRVGIYMGKQEDSSDQYVFQLEDEYGSILGKAVVPLSDMRENEFLYVPNRSVNYTNATYYIKIYSADTGEGRQSLKIKASLASDFKTMPFSVSGEESEYTLVLNRRYQAISRRPAAYIGLAIAAITAAAWLADTKIIDFFKKNFYECMRNIPWRKVVTVAIGLFLAADLILPFFPQTDYIAQSGNRSSRSVREYVIDLKEGVVVEQCIKVNSGDIDSLGLLFATYMQVIRDGVVHVEAQDADNGSLLFSESIKTKEIADNSYQYVQVPKTVNLYGKNVLLRVWAEYTNESTPVALYYNENSSSSMYAVIDGESQDTSLIFEFSTQTKTYRAEMAIVITAVLILLIVIYLWKFVHFQHIWHKYFICVPLVAILLLFPTLSLLHFGEISLNGITALLPNQSKWATPRTFEEAELKKNLSVERGYDLSGANMTCYERTEIPVNGLFSNISLHFLGAAMRKDEYVIRIYWDTGNGYNDKQVYSYKYIHQGANSVSFYVPCDQNVKTIWITTGQELGAGILEGLPDEILPLNRVEINSLPSTSLFFSPQTPFIFTAILGLLAMGCLWKHIHIDAWLEKKLRSRNISISFIFVVIATIYGAIFSFLTPTYQTPDEGTHLTFLSMDLGDTTIATRLTKAIGTQGQEGVMRHQGQTVDSEAYLEASTSHLDDYNLYGIPSIRVVQRPGQTIGILLGMLLHLPAYWILQLAELGGLAVYVAMGALTLKIIPIKKTMMMMIMLLPVTIQQAGSLSYDSFTNAISFFTVAYILYLKLEAKKVSWKQIFILFLLAMGLLIGKIIYVLLLGLVLIIPLSKLELEVGSVTITGDWIETHKRYIAAVVVVMGFVGYAGVWLILDKVMRRSYIIGLVGAYISQLPQLLRLYVVTTRVHWVGWQGAMIAGLGWSDVGVNGTFMIMIAVSLFICALIHHKKADVSQQIEALHRGKIFSAYDLLIWYGIYILLFAAILMSMVEWGFMSWSINTSLPYAVKMRLLPRIEGVGGRYFLPILPLILIPIHIPMDIFKGLPVGFCRICYYLCITVYPISLLLGRYWGVGQ